MWKLFLSFSLFAVISAWSPQTKTTLVPKFSHGNKHNNNNKNSFDPLNISDDVVSAAAPKKSFMKDHPLRPGTIALAGMLPVISNPDAATAATAFTPNAVPSALAAYGHYVSLIGVLACIMVERLTVKPDMSAEDEDVLVIADTGLGIFGALIAYTGYLRAVEYEKGFDFYSHEPLFWLKIVFAGIFGASSFFNTVVIIQRSLARRNGKFVPMGEKLSKRMIQICNAEIVAISVIPLTATFMARGVWYSEDIPWQAEAALAALVFAGLSFKYVKEALQFEDNPISLDSSS